MSTYRVAVGTSSTADLRYLQSNMITLNLNSSEWVSLLSHSSKDSFFSDIQNYMQSHKTKQKATDLVI